MSCSGSHSGRGAGRRVRRRPGRTARPRTSGWCQKRLLRAAADDVGLVAREVGEVVERRRELRERLRRTASRPRSARRCTSAASIAGRRLPSWTSVAGIAVRRDVRAPPGSSTADGSLTTSTTFHEGECPCGGSIPLFPDVHHSVDEQHHEAGERRERDEEAEPGAEVGREQQVGRTAEQPDRREHDEHAEDGRVPEIRVGRALGDLGDEVHHHGHTFAALTVVVVVGGVRGVVPVTHIGCDAEEGRRVEAVALVADDLRDLVRASACSRSRACGRFRCRCCRSP